MLTRRQFFRLLAPAFTLPLIAPRRPRVQFGCQTNAWKIDPRDFASFLAILERIRHFHFDGFETGFANLEPHFQAAAAAKQIAETGLRFFGVHIFLLEYDPETSIAPAALYRRVVDGASRLGAERLVLSGAPVASGGRLNSPALARKVRALATAASYAREHGMGFAYHNEMAEFAAGAAEMEALLGATDRALVHFLIDAGHAFESGADVPAFFAQHHARIVGFHLRDYRGQQQVPLGQGEFNLPGLAAAMEKANWSGWALVEEERPGGVKLGDAAVGPARATLQRVFAR